MIADGGDNLIVKDKAFQSLYNLRFNGLLEKKKMSENEWRIISKD